MKAKYTIVFHYFGAYETATKFLSKLLPTKVDHAEIEMFWTRKGDRDRAEKFLATKGITVDTFTLA